MKQYYFISDLHIGGDSILDECNFKIELIDFLKSLIKFDKSTELILLGDIFSLREITSVSGIDKLKYIIKNHSELFEQFKITGSIINITLVPGNHDMELVTDVNFKKILKKYNINLIKSPSIKRTLGNAKLRIEHGNQLDKYNKFAKWGDLENLPLGYYFNRNLVNKIERYMKSSKSKWLMDLVSVQPYKDVPYWILSNYFYREMNPILRYSILPFILLLFVSIIVLIMTLMQKIGLVESKFFLQDFKSHFGIFGNILDFIIFVDSIFIVSILVVGAPLTLFIKDFLKAIRKFNFPLGKLEGKKALLRKIRGIFDQNNDVNVFIYGHTHEPGVLKEKGPNGHRYILNTGTWLKTFKKIKSWVKFMPPVYIPSQNLSIIRLYAKKEKAIIEYKCNKKNVNHKMSTLEKIFTFGKQRDFYKNIPNKLIIK